MKKIWVTSLTKDKEIVNKVLSQIKKYGLAPVGHFWIDDLKKMAWISSKEDLLDPKTSLWIIIGSEKEFKTDSIRMGLSLLSLSLQSKKGNGFPILWICTKGNIDNQLLPTPLKSAEILDITSATIGVKVTALANTPIKNIDIDYRLEIHAFSQMGIWFEVGPANNHNWTGALFGTNDSEIVAHGVGPKGKVPEKATLEYPIKGLKLTLNEQEYNAWGLKNKLDSNSSYYVLVRDAPSNFIFGQNSDDDSLEINCVKL